VVPETPATLPVSGNNAGTTSFDQGFSQAIARRVHGTGTSLLEKPPCLGESLAHLEPVDAFRQHATSRKAGSLGRAKEHPATARYVDDLFPAVDDEKLLEATEVSLDESSADEVIGA
jgi:hypothetical protein